MIAVVVRRMKALDAEWNELAGLCDLLGDVDAPATGDHALVTEAQPAIVQPSARSLKRQASALKFNARSEGQRRRWAKRGK